MEQWRTVAPEISPPCFLGVCRERFFATHAMALGAHGEGDFIHRGKLLPEP
jgi:hypothetical protein